MILRASQILKVKVSDPHLPWRRKISPAGVPRWLLPCQCPVPLPPHPPRAKHWSTNRCRNKRRWRKEDFLELLSWKEVCRLKYFNEPAERRGGAGGLAGDNGPGSPGVGLLGEGEGESLGQALRPRSSEEWLKAACRVFCSVLWAASSLSHPYLSTCRVQVS